MPNCRRSICQPPLQELSAGSQLEEDSTVLIDPFSWRYHFLKQS